MCVLLQRIHEHASMYMPMCNTFKTCMLAIFCLDILTSTSRVMMAADFTLDNAFTSLMMTNTTNSTNDDEIEYNGVKVEASIDKL